MNEKGRVTLVRNRDEGYRFKQWWLQGLSPLELQPRPELEPSQVAELRLGLTLLMLELERQIRSVGSLSDDVGSEYASRLAHSEALVARCSELLRSAAPLRSSDDV